MTVKATIHHKSATLSPKAGELRYNVHGYGVAMMFREISESNGTRLSAIIISGEHAGELVSFTGCMQDWPLLDGSITLEQTL